MREGSKRTGIRNQSPEAGRFYVFLGPFDKTIRYHGSDIIVVVGKQANPLAYKNFICVHVEGKTR